MDCIHKLNIQYNPESDKMRRQYCLQKSPNKTEPTNKIKQQILCLIIRSPLSNCPLNFFCILHKQFKKYVGNYRSTYFVALIFINPALNYNVVDLYANYRVPTMYPVFHM